MSSTLQLHSIEIENLRGYDHATLPLDRPKTILVGKNNSGKTSILKLLNWILNDLDVGAVKSKKVLSPDGTMFLMPARDTRNRARRLWLRVEVTDGRRHRGLQCDRDGIASIRAVIKVSPEPTLILKIGEPSRNESNVSDPKAIELLEEIRRSFLLIYVPSFRDAGSERFSNTLRASFRALLAEGALHAKQAGAPAEYRKVKGARDNLKNVSEELVNPLWKVMKANLPPGLAKDAKIEFECEPEDLVDWMSSRLSMRLTTGDHDQHAVDVVELGSGLQSLLDLVIQKDLPSSAGQVLMAVEEPEAFLHPSAQRTLSRKLINDSFAKVKLLTTHSPIIIEEARYGDVVLVRDQSFIVPASHNNEKRDDINSALMNGYGAELMFARAVMFVEGEGDRQFFEALRRRIAAVDESGSVDDAIVIPVGSKTRFAPWINLVNSYGTGTTRPFHWLVTADGDATAEVREAFRNSNVSVPHEVGTGLTSINQESGSDAKANRIRDLNTTCRSSKFQLRLLPVDLESAALENTSAPTRGLIARKAGWNDIRGRNAKIELLRRLGSKMVDNPGDKGKAPWIRGFIGHNLPWNEVSDEIKSILKDWISMTMSEREVEKLLRNAR